MLIVDVSLPSWRLFGAGFPPSLDWPIKGNTSVLVVPDTVKCISLVGMCFRRAPHSASVIDLLATEY